MKNLEIYEQVRRVPEEACKGITGGRLNGMTDINPMWRIKTLTERFGPCGVGWKYVVTDKRLENGANGEIAAFMDIDLYVKVEGEWSEAIPGTGGSSFVAKERSGLYTSDECFKMALTDALSVACKALGFGADVYWAKGRTKYSAPAETAREKIRCADCGALVTDTVVDGKRFTAEQIAGKAMKEYGRPLCMACALRAKEGQGA